VEVTVDASNTITAIKIGDDQFAETAGFGAQAQEEAFLNQFIGKTLPVESFDAIAGATITSDAIAEAFKTINSSVAQETAAGTVLAGSAQGFAGPVAVEVTVDANNTITAIKIGDDQFAETAGFGAQAQEEAFLNQFIGKTLPVESFDAIAGATITSDAIAEAFKTINSSVTQESAAGTVLAGSAQGFAGPVAVEVTVDANNTITAIKIGDDQFAETEGFGANALEDAFQNQFIGKSLPVAVTDIDAIAGATITTNAVIEAINNAAGMSNEQTVDTTAAATVDATSSATAAVVEETVLTASAQGFAGPVAVEVTVDANNTIIAIKIGDDQFAETDGFGAQAQEEAFLNQFIGKTLPVESFDAIAGATITSDAIAEAFKTINSNVAQESAAETVLTASAQGFAGPVAVEVTVDANNTITAIKIGDDQFAETDGFGAQAQEEAFLNQFIGKTLPVESFDAIAGATITSDAIAEAFKTINSNIAQESAAETVLTASAQGFAGPVAVEVTVDANNTIIAIKIGDDQFAETDGFGAKAQEDAFLNQFIGKTLPVESFDAIAGATITSDAIAEALSQLAAE